MHLLRREDHSRKDGQVCPRNRTNVWAKTAAPWAPRHFQGEKVEKVSVARVASGLGWDGGSQDKVRGSR